MQFILKQEGLTNKWGGGSGGYYSPEKHLETLRNNMVKTRWFLILKTFKQVSSQENKAMMKKSLPCKRRVRENN